MKKLLLIPLILLCLAMSAGRTSRQTVEWADVGIEMLDTALIDKVELYPDRVQILIEMYQIYPITFLAYRDSNEHILHTSQFDIKFRNYIYYLDEEPPYNIRWKSWMIFYVLEHANGHYKVMAQNLINEERPDNLFLWSVVGWISDTVPLITKCEPKYAMPYRIYEAPSYHSALINEKDTIGPRWIEVLDVDGPWLKGRYLFEGDTIVGWVPKESQYGSTY